MAIKRRDYDPAAMFGSTSTLTALTAAKTLVGEDSGKVFMLNLAAGFAVTLPAPTSGMEFTFIVKTAPSGGSYTIVANGTSAIIKGFDVNAAAGAGDTGSPNTTITFANGQAVAGDRVNMITDGTYWYAIALSAVAAGITFDT